MLDVLGSLQNLQWVAEHHYLHISNRHDFIRPIAVQYEMAYTDFRAVQMALQMAGEHELLVEFTKSYGAVSDFEMAFVRGGMPEFDQTFPGKMAAYDAAKDALVTSITHIRKLQPAITPENKLI